METHLRNSSRSLRIGRKLLVEFLSDAEGWPAIGHEKQKRSGSGEKKKESKAGEIAWTEMGMQINLEKEGNAISLGSLDHRTGLDWGTYEAVKRFGWGGES